MPAGNVPHGIAMDGSVQVSALGSDQHGANDHQHILVTTPNHRIGAIRKVLIWQGAWELHGSDTQKQLTPVP